MTMAIIDKESWRLAEGRLPGKPIQVHIVVIAVAVTVVILVAVMLRTRYKDKA